MWSQRISVDFLRAGWCACALAHGAQGRGAGAGPLTCALCWCAAPCWRTVLFSQRRGWWGAFVGRAPRRAETLNRRTALSNATRDKQNTQANTKYRAEGHRNENNSATATRVPPPTQQVIIVWLSLRVWWLWWFVIDCCSLSPLVAVVPKMNHRAVVSS